MRLRLVLVVLATSLLILFAFLVPLALLVRASAADRAVNAAVVDIQSLAPVITSTDRQTLQKILNEGDTELPRQVTVFLPDGTAIGAPAPRSTAVASAAGGKSTTARAPGGREVLVAVAGLPDGTAVIRTFVPDAELRRGVSGAWTVLVLLGLGLLLVSALVADQLARSLIRPIGEVAAVSRRLADGDLGARAVPDGPPEVRAVGAGLNLLADRIGQLLSRERENVADLSHRLRTPLTALRIDAEALPNPPDQARIMADLDALERTVNDVIRAARSPVRTDAAPSCDAVQVVTERIKFWSALAEEERREVSVAVHSGPILVGVNRDDLSACVDALLDNVFAHTPEGTGFALRLTDREGGGGRLVVSDRGPGLPQSVVRRGRSGRGSTGLGLDIAERTAKTSGGALTVGANPGGGAAITVDLGSPGSRPLSDPS